jgi:cell division control protein 7
VNRAGTRGFRAPEVLLRNPIQTYAVDVWSAGSILLSIVLRRYPIFRGATDEIMLAELVALLGMPTLKQLGGMELIFEGHRRVHPTEPMTLRDLYVKLNGDAYVWPEELFDLLSQCLDWNASTRITAEKALDHPFFHTLYTPHDPSLPNSPTASPSPPTVANAVADC